MNRVATWNDYEITAAVASVEIEPIKWLSCCCRRGPLVENGGPENIVEALAATSHSINIYLALFPPSRSFPSLPPNPGAAPDKFPCKFYSSIRLRSCESSLVIKRMAARAVVGAGLVLRSLKSEPRQQQQPTALRGKEGLFLAVVRGYSRLQYDSSWHSTQTTFVTRKRYFLCKGSTPSTSENWSLKMRSSHGSFNHWESAFQNSIRGLMDERTVNFSGAPSLLFVTDVLKLLK